MLPLPDPAEIDAIAARIHAHAEVARDRAYRLESTVASAAWHGLAADAFDLLAADVINGLRRSADRLDDAADALRRHAEAVRHVLAVLTRLELDSLGTGADLGAGVLDEVLDPARLPGDTISVLADAGHVLGDLGSLIGIG